MEVQQECCQVEPFPAEYYQNEIQRCERNYSHFFHLLTVRGWDLLTGMKKHLHITQPFRVDLQINLKISLLTFEVLN